MSVAHVFEKKWRSDDVRLRDDMDFSGLLLGKRVLDGLSKAGFKKPSPIQVEAIPSGRAGKDLIVQAKSGTGKTLVFVIVALEKLKRHLFRPQVLVIVPTREIAVQVCSVVKAVGCCYRKLVCNSFIGGLPLADDQQKAVMTQIAVGTPGRLCQLINMKSLPTNSIRLVIFDEADELLRNKNFKDDMEGIFSSLPDDKQVIVTSATFNLNVRKEMAQYISNPSMIRLSAKHLALLGMVHYAEVVEFCPLPVIMYKSKLIVLEKILRSVKFAQCLLFCNGIQRVDVLYNDIKRWGFSVTYISSAKDQQDRLKAIEKLKRFKCKVLVSSDLTARGIDAENVDLVINFDLAQSSETYLHRVGRAGRYDPVPRDIILYPPETEFVTVESDSEDVKIKKSKVSVESDLEDVKIKRARKSKKIKRVVLNGDDGNLEEEASSENIQQKCASKSNGDISNDACNNEPAEITAVADVKSAEDIAECNIKLENSVRDDDALSKNKNVKTVDLNEQITVKNLQNGYADNCIGLNKNENFDLLNECNPKELIDSESSDKPCTCDNYKNPVDFHDTNIVEKQDMAVDNGSVGNFFETDGEKLDGKHLEKIPETSELKDCLKDKDVPVNPEQKNISKPPDTLCDIIKAFVSAYESNKELESVESKATFDNVGVPKEDSDKNLITMDMLDKLKSQKNDFFYKILKDFQDNKDCSSISKNENDEKENNETNSSAKWVGEKVVHAELSEKSESNSVHVKLGDEVQCTESLPGKPTFESTPQLSDKMKQNTNVPADEEPVPKPFQQPFVSFESHFSEQTEESEESESPMNSEVEKQNSSIDFESDSSSSDSSSQSSSSSSEDTDSEADSSESESNSDLSESESSSDDSDSSSSTTTSSENEEDESAYHHNYSRTGRQNPSLVSGSVGDQVRNDPFYYHGYFQDPKCACCGTKVKGKMPCQRTMRYQNVPHANSSYFRRFENAPHYGNSYSLDHRGNSYPNRVPKTRRGPSFADHYPSPSYCRRKHSRFHRFKNPSSRSITRRERARNESECLIRNIGGPSLDDQNTTQAGCQKKHSRCHRSENPSSSTARRERVQNRGDPSSDSRDVTRACCPKKHSRCQRSENPISSPTRRERAQNGSHPRSSRHCHTLDCFLPTQHRCHPNTSAYPCSQGPLCEMWYNTFYCLWCYINGVFY